MRRRENCPGCHKPQAIGTDDSRCSQCGVALHWTDGTVHCKGDICNDICETCGGVNHYTPIYGGYIYECENCNWGPNPTDGDPQSVVGEAKKGN